MKTSAASPPPAHLVDRRCCAATLLVALLAAGSPLHAVDPGSLDPDFDGDGRLSVGLDTGGSFNELTNDVALQADGMAVAVGYSQFSASDTDFLIVRFDASGNLDPAFHADGIATVPFDLLPGNNDDNARAVAIQPDGRIVVAGYVTAAAGGTDLDCGVARLLADGSLDTSFGVVGKVVIGFDLGDNQVDRCFDLLVQPDGRIVVVGAAQVASLDFDFIVVRLLADGTLDPSFDGDGKLVVPVAVQDLARAVVRQADGKLVVGGFSQGTGGFAAAVVRIDASGALDGSFGTGGKVTFAPVGVEAAASALALDSEGRVVVAGSTLVSQVTRSMLVARLTSGGQLDASFGGGGMTSVDFGSPNELAAGNSLALLPDDRILVVGVTNAAGTPTLASSSLEFAAIQLEPTGILDLGFGAGGRVRVPFDLGQQNTDWANAVVLRPDGRLLIAGGVDGPDGSGDDLGFAQLYSSLVFADGCESGDLTAWSATVP